MKILYNLLFYICFHNLDFFYKLELVYLNENLDLDLLELIYFNGNFVKLVIFLNYIFFNLNLVYLNNNKINNIKM